ncbi:MAG: hypothetical protein ABI610_02210 [Acidobacteriota bacterium]
MGTRMTVSNVRAKGVPVPQEDRGGDLGRVERYRRAADHLAAAQIYLKANPLLEELFSWPYGFPRD